MSRRQRRNKGSGYIVEVFKGILPRIAVLYTLSSGLAPARRQAPTRAQYSTTGHVRTILSFCFFSGSMCPVFATTGFHGYF